MIADSVAFLVAQGKTVVYDAEHFFDAWRDDSGYALECLRAAITAGAASTVSLRRSRRWKAKVPACFSEASLWS